MDKKICVRGFGEVNLAKNTEEDLEEQLAHAKEETPECKGHPAGEFDQTGTTVYCDGSCVRKKVVT